MGELTKFLNEIADKYKNYWYDTLNRPEVSVIIPAYNVEKYVETCLSSILKQTFTNFETIVIDDGSTDLTPEIANVFQHCDKRFKLISQKNRGISYARNVGLNNANGKYITFVDSDDWIDEKYIENLYNSITKNNCDIAVASIIRKRSNSQKYRVHYTEEKTYTSFKDKIQCCNVPRCCYAWGKMYKKDLVTRLNFKEGVYFEDVIWTPQILELSNKLVTVPNCNYYYMVNKSSIVKKIQSKKKQLDAYKAKKFAINYLISKGVEIAPKERNLTKEIKYFCGIPILKIKEQDKILTTLLFGLIPVYKKTIFKKLKYQNIKRFLFFRNLDSHYYVELFKCLKISFKNCHKFEYAEAQKFGLTEQPRETKLIVSLTSFPERIPTAHIAINTLLNQTVKPDKLILWLAENQFPDKEKDLPENLLKLKELGLEIRWCEDLKSYKKLVPALKEFPNDIIVTADDDLYYQQDWLESLYSAYQKAPNYIYTRRACGINLKDNVLSITPHYANSNHKPTYLNQLMGGAGTLYPPHALYDDVFNFELIKNLIPTHDDIYFWIMSVLKGSKICLIKNKDTNIYNIEEAQTTALCKQHKKQSFGMHPSEAFSKILEHYPQTYNILEEESTCKKLV